MVVSHVIWLVTLPRLYVDDYIERHGSSHIDCHGTRLLIREIKRNRVTIVLAMKAHEVEFMRKDALGRIDQGWLPSVLLDSARRTVRIFDRLSVDIKASQLATKRHFALERKQAKALGFGSMSVSGDLPCPI